MSDASGLVKVSVTVTRNGESVFTSTDSSGTFDFNDLGPGDYQLTVDATDADNDRPATRPAATRPVGERHRRRHRIADDRHRREPGRPERRPGPGLHLERGRRVGAFEPQRVVIYERQHGLHVHRRQRQLRLQQPGPRRISVIVSATDADTDWSGDQSSNDGSRTVVVTDDDTAAPVINLGGSQTAENDGQNQHFTWNVSDFSGLASLLVTVTKNGGTIFTSAAASGSFDFNSFGLGTYEITVNATDADTDWTGDQLSNSASRSVTVSDDDTAQPQIVLGGSTGGETDGDTNHFTWNVTDGSGLTRVDDHHPA